MTCSLLYFTDIAQVVACYSLVAMLILGVVTLIVTGILVIVLVVVLVEWICCASHRKITLTCCTSETLLLIIVLCVIIRSILRTAISCFYHAGICIGPWLMSRCFFIVSVASLIFVCVLVYNWITIIKGNNTDDLCIKFFGQNI